VAPAAAAAVAEVSQSLPALADAAMIIERCEATGFLSLAGNLARQPLTATALDERLAQASELRDVLAAAGMSSKLDAVMAAIDNPVALARTLITEARAAASDGSDICAVNQGTAPPKAAADPYGAGAVL